MFQLRAGIATAVLFFSTVMSVKAVEFRVAGEATDSVGSPEIYATVRVYSLTDTVKPVSLGTTDELGRFSQALKKEGSYRLMIHSVGKKPYDGQFSVSAAKPEADMGRVVLLDNTNELGEVQVVAQRPLVSREIDRLAYDVKGDPDAETNTLREILRKVPLVSVDDDGTIKVKGSSSFKIYKNGRPNNSYSKNAKEIFAALPASTIKKIEVITDPGSREDAEGEGVILNIVTDKETAIKGVMGSASLYTTSTMRYPMPNLWLSSQVGKVTVSVNGGFNYISRHASRHKGVSRTEYLDSGNVREITSNSQSGYHSAYGGMEASWEPDTMNLFTMEMNVYGYGAQKNVPQTGTSSLFDANGGLLSSYKTITTPYSSYFDLDGSANYQRSTGLKGETLTLSYRISTTGQNSDSETEYTDMVNWDLGYSGINSKSHLRFIEQTVQADWARPVGEKMKFDVGGKAIFRDNHSLSDYDYVGLRQTHDDFTHRTSIAALYADYRLMLGKWNFRAGMRYEYSYLSAKFKEQTESHPDFHSSLNDWVPNIAVSWNTTDASSLKMSFNRNIRRPSIGTLDPTRKESPTSVSFGNPDLESEVFNNLSLNYSLFTNKLNMDFSAGGTFVNNAVSSTQWLEDGRFFSTYGNIAKRRSAYLALYFQWGITSTTRLMVNGSCDYSYMSQPSEIDSEGNVGTLSRGRWGGYCFLRVSQKLPWKIEASANGSWWYSGLSSVYSYSKPELRNASYGFSFTRRFLKEDRLSVMLMFQSIFGPSKRKNTSYTYNPDYRTVSFSSSTGRRNVMLSVSFRFGSYSASVKKTAASISNDDLEGRSKESNN